MTDEQKLAVLKQYLTSYTFCGADNLENASALLDICEFLGVSNRDQLGADILRHQRQEWIDRGLWSKRIFDIKPT